MFRDDSERAPPERRREIPASIDSIFSTSTRSQDFLRRHLREFRAAKKVGAESPEMAAHKLTQFARRLFIRKRNLKIALCQTSIFPGKHPRANTEELSERQRETATVARRQLLTRRDRGDKRQNRALQDRQYRSAAPQGRFACGLLQPI